MPERKSLSGAIAFRPLGTTDLPLLRGWLSQDFVNRWYGGGAPSLEAVTQKYAPRIAQNEEASDPVLCFIIQLDENPIGLIQTYRIDDYPDYLELIGLEEEAAGLDILIGERAFVQQGLGPRIMRAFLEAIVFERFTVESCLAGPHPDNRVAIAACRKAGFSHLKKVVDVETGQAECVMRITRDALTS